MTEHQNGLRFDIYERVYLDEASAPIGELDEMELIPHIQVVQENEQAVLQGNLWLTGKYTGENGEESRTLEHFIPVEITLPMNRIQRLEDITVEIETFDVDLLSSKSINVTGVLSLHGIEMISRADETWKEEEEFRVVHQAEESAPYLTSEVRQNLPEDNAQSARGAEGSEGSTEWSEWADRAGRTDRIDRSSWRTEQTEQTEHFGDVTADRQFRSSAPPPSSWSRQQEENEPAFPEGKAADPVSEPFRTNEHGAWGQTVESDASVSSADSSDSPSFDASASSSTSEEAKTVNTEFSEFSREEKKPSAAEVQKPPVEEVQKPPAAEVQKPPAVEVQKPPAAEVQKQPIAEVQKLSPELKDNQELSAANKERPEALAEANEEVNVEVLAEDQETVDVVFPSDKQEMKIAFKSAEPSSSYHLKNLVSKVDVAEEVHGHRAEENTNEPEPSVDSEPLEFRRLVASNAKEEEQQFRRMKMCIVQKEETLETIAERYNLNPREIVLYNRLGDQQVEEGQVLYIP